jgi:hypothetical protein
MHSFRPIIYLSRIIHHWVVLSGRANNFFSLVPQPGLLAALLPSMSSLSRQTTTTPHHTTIINVIITRFDKPQNYS